jgi:hypothetical protein
MHSMTDHVVGMVSGRLRVIVASDRTKNGRRALECVCAVDLGGCGRVTMVRRSSITSGRTTSCGCARRDKLVARCSKHGHAEGRRQTPEFSAWIGMKERCRNPRTKSFSRYGGRGITVCDRWRESFAAFLADMGPRPSPVHSIDRINNDGNYEPNNCRWATRREQSRNRGDNIVITINGESLCAVDWAERAGIPVSVITGRIRTGWNPEAAVMTPKLTRRFGSSVERDIRSRGLAAIGGSL